MSNVYPTTTVASDAREDVAVEVLGFWDLVAENRAWFSDGDWIQTFE